jgi:hypothetical protein
MTMMAMAEVMISFMAVILRPSHSCQQWQQ